MLCVYCRMSRGTTKDHVIPKSVCKKLGISSQGLVLPCCEACNFWKADKMLHEWDGPVSRKTMRLRVGELAWSASLRFSHKE